MSVSYATRRLFAAKQTPVISDINFSIQRGRIMGVVGESGSGKTTLVRGLLRLVPAFTGSITFNNMDWLALNKKELATQRRRIGVVSQNPFLSLSPRLSIAKILTEPLHADGQSWPTTKTLGTAVESVGLSADILDRKAAALSGGQAQRVAIARALMLEPDLLVLDEATSALDVSVQAQVLNLLLDIRKRSNISMLFVSHDLAVVRHLSDDLLVMNQGNIVEQGLTQHVTENPQHRYTQKLLSEFNGAV